MTDTNGSDDMNDGEVDPIDPDDQELADSLLSDEDGERLIQALAAGQETFTEEDALIAIEWARMTTLNSTMLDLVLEGRIAIQIDPETREVVFIHPEHVGKEVPLDPDIWGALPQ